MKGVFHLAGFNYGLSGDGEWRLPVQLPAPGSTLLHPFTQAGLSTLMLIPLCSVTHGWWLDSRGMTRPQTTCGAVSRRALLAVTYAGAI